ncbi:MAG: thioesterase family protein [Sphingomicrobium sp.]
MSEPPVFEMALTALPEHIDVLGHVNNAVWIQWMERVATAHWEAVAAKAHQAAYFWVVVRHEVDYLRPAHDGDRIVARTWAEPPQGAKSVRVMEFLGNDGRPCVRSRTTWAIIDQSAGRPIRVPEEVIAPFMGKD